MWRFSFLFVCFLVICSFCGGGRLVDKYCREFWLKGEEAPPWKRRACPYPLPFEELSIEESLENIVMVQRQVSQDWKLEDCLLALRLLVDRDMQKKIETFPWEDFEDEALFVEGGSVDSAVSNDFWQTVLFANYFVGCFRARLKARLKELGANPDEELKKIVRSFLPKKCERPRSPYGVSVTGM